MLRAQNKLKNSTKYIMHLECAQTIEPIRQSDGGFYVAGRFMDNEIHPLSKFVIDKIPPEKRREKKSEELDDQLGINIYSGLGVTVGGGLFSGNSVSSGKFLFSVSRETMHRFLPRMTIEFPEDLPQKNRVPAVRRLG